MIKKYIFLILLIMTASSVTGKSENGTASKVANSVNIKKRAQILLAARTVTHRPYARRQNQRRLIMHRPQQVIFQDIPDDVDEFLN